MFRPAACIMAKKLVRIVGPETEKRDLDDPDVGETDVRRMWHVVVLSIHPGRNNY
jgi:hypothetical protein